MYISINNSKRQDWDKVKSWNYKLDFLKPEMSVVYAEVVGEHGDAETKESEWIYYIIEGNGEFMINRTTTKVSSGDVITIPPHTKYTYRSVDSITLKVVMFIDLWDN
ncbi:MAG TPA: AraC family ligand binding domain-containing protein [Candidatus Saccharimonadales bacterium]|nr:AraC family ligand binding domain-containing protein [Candidatus Saccharimonadales bacterium]